MLSSSEPPPGASKLPLGLDLSTKHRAYDAVGVAVMLAVLLVVCDGVDVPVPVSEEVGERVRVSDPVFVVDGELVGDGVSVSDEDGVPLTLAPDDMVGVCVAVSEGVGLSVPELVCDGVCDDVDVNDVVGDIVWLSVPDLVCV